MTQTLEHTPEHEQPAQPDLAAPSPAQPTWIRQRRFQVLAGALAVLALSGTAVGITSHQHAVAAEQQRTAAAAAAAKAAAAERARLAILTNAVSSCGLSNTTSVDVGDAGRSLTIDTVGTDERVRQALGKSPVGGATMRNLGCVLRHVNVPDSVVANMSATRALDGRQHATWDDLTASWSYHPDSGFNLVLTVA